MNARWEKGTLQPMGKLAQRIRLVRKTAKLSQEKFAEALGEVEGVKITRGAVGNWELGGGISRANLAAISAKFGVSLDWLEHNTGEGIGEMSNVPKTGTTKSIMSDTRQSSGAPVKFIHNAKLGPPVADLARVPIRGRGMGGKQGALIFEEGEFFGETAAHPKVVGVPDAYAVYVIGDSMLERFKHGEIVYVHPYAPYIPGDDVLIQVQSSDGQPVYGWVKRFISQDAKTLKVRQLNPKKILTFPTNTVLKIEKIVGSGSL